MRTRFILTLTALYLAGSPLHAQQPVPMQGQPGTTYVIPDYSGPDMGYPGQPVMSSSTCMDCNQGAGSCIPQQACRPEDSSQCYGGISYLIWEYQDPIVIPPLGIQFSVPLSVTRFDVTVDGGTSVIATPESFTAQLISNPIIAGGLELDNPDFPGFRATLGTWCDPWCKDCGLEVSVFAMDSNTQEFAAASELNPALPSAFDITTPFSDTVTVTTTGGDASGGSESPILIQAVASLRTNGEVETKEFWGVEANCRKRWLYVSNVTLDCICGLRYLNFEEELRLNQTASLLIRVPERSLEVDGIEVFNVPESTTRVDVTTEDRYDTRNRFFGPQIGASFEWNYKKCFLAGFSKLAVGHMCQVVEIDGTNTVTVTTTGDPAPTLPVPGTTTQAGGLFSIPQDVGRHRRNELVCIPEFSLRLGCYCTPNCRAFIGYNLMQINNLARPANQIKAGGNRTTISVLDQQSNVNFDRQAFRFDGEDEFEAEGAEFGVEFRY